jgi:HK97 family phage major capsid protein/HK97 family phage prohead protease
MTTLRATSDPSPRYWRQAALVLRQEPGEEEVTIELSMSSEAPVTRYDWEGPYQEILSHERDAVLLGPRTAQGLPLLADHQPPVLARVTDLRIEDGRLRGRITRWRQNPEAQDVRQAVLDGILVDASIGYQIHETVRTDRETNGQRTILVTRWEPLEVSLVAVPADPTVGVGRSSGAPDVPPSKEMSMSHPVGGRPEMPPTQTAAAPHGAAHHVTVTMTEDPAQTLEAWVQGIREPRAKAYAEQRLALWREYSVPLAEAKREVYQHLTTVQPVLARTPDDGGLTPRDVQRYSLARAINTMLQGRRDGLEFEVSEDLARRLGRADAKGLLVPWPILATGYAQRANELTVGTAATGGHLRMTDYGGFVEMLRNRVVSFRLGVQYLPGLQGNVAFVRQTGAHTFSWQSTEIATATNTAWTLAQVVASPKIGQVVSHISRQLLTQAVESVEDRVRSDLAQVHAIGIDKAIIAGSGASGEPTGISNTSGIGDVAGGANGAQPTYGNIIELWADVATANADTANLRYLTHPLGVARLAQTQRFSSTETPLWEFGPEPGTGFINKMPAMYSAQVPSAQTKGTSTDCYYIYFGDWSAATLCEWGALELTVDPYTQGPSMVRLTSIQMVDVAVVRPAAFSVMKDARP